MLRRKGEEMGPNCEARSAIPYSAVGCMYGADNSTLYLSDLRTYLSRLGRVLDLPTSPHVHGGMEEEENLPQMGSYL